MTKPKLGSLLVLIGAVTTAAAVVLPWYSTAGTTYSGIQDGGSNFMVTFGVAVVLAVLGLWMYAKPAGKAPAITTLVLSLIALGWSALLYFAVKSVLDLGAALGVPTSSGLGLFVVILGSVLAVVGSIVGLVAASGARPIPATAPARA